MFQSIQGHQDERSTVQELSDDSVMDTIVWGVIQTTLYPFQLPR